ncbi:uncharacterized protein LOC130997002 [Salvia miltiorrhiza]|uniref:uncharacterized protein LOC130997002 n=1 Tax=Salvia miltiorrhiza TaxID=226208 RepID=UPI0025ACA306|nr:uncharacterized protein LOC130997002 [Salvia miltiorrhiza]
MVMMQLFEGYKFSKGECNGGLITIWTNEMVVVKVGKELRGSELVSDCLKCCAEDSDDATSKVIYSGAILEVCMRKLVFYPELVGFIEEEKDKFPSVKVQYAFNTLKETIRVDNWKREHILQFLKEKVKPSSDT